jgi:hypothetical protein
VIDGDPRRAAAAAQPAEARAAALEAALGSGGCRSAGARIELEALREQPRERALELMPLVPELAALHSARAPRVVSLRDGSGTRISPLLRALSGDYALLDGIVPGATLRVTQSDLLRHLDGEVYALWRDYEALPDVLGSARAATR